MQSRDHKALTSWCYRISNNVGLIQGALKLFSNARLPRAVHKHPAKEEVLDAPASAPRWRPLPVVNYSPGAPRKKADWLKSWCWTSSRAMCTATATAPAPLRKTRWPLPWRKSWWPAGRTATCPRRSACLPTCRTWTANRH